MKERWIGYIEFDSICDLYKRWLCLYKSVQSVFKYQKTHKHNNTPENNIINVYTCEVEEQYGKFTQTIHIQKD